MTVGGGDSATVFSTPVSELGVVGSGTAATAVLGLQLEARNNKTGASCPIARSPLPPLVTPKHYMMQAQLAPDALSCALWTAFQNNALHTHYDGSNPGDFPLPLHTADWALLVPALTAMYPNSEMDVNVTFASAVPPSITASGKDGLVLNATAEFSFGVLSSAQNLRARSAAAPGHVFTITVQSISGLNARIVKSQNSATGRYGPVLKFDASHLTLNFAVIDSSIGHVSVAGAQRLSDLVLPAVKAVINYAGDIGFSLPALGGMQFENPAVVIQDSVLSINTNVTFQIQ